MKQTRVRHVVVAICAALSLAPSSFAQVPPLWGALQPGPERVGFTTVFRFDPERTWARTYDAAGVFVPDSNGRPVQVSVWYPAQATGPCAGMSFGGAVDVDVVVPPPLTDFASAMRLRNREDAHSAVPAERFSELLSSPLHSCAGAPPSGGDAPLVLYAGGLNASVISNIVLAEFLASHGFAVASVSLVGAGDAQVTQSRSAIDLEATVRDLEFASTVVRQLGLARGTRVAVVGHSLGAVAAMIFAARHGNTRAAIGLDGTYGFEGAGSLLTTGFGYDPTRMRAAVLDIRRAEGEQEARLDMASVRAMKYARRDLVAIGAMHHSDFTSFAMVADRFLTPIDPKYAGTRWDRRTGRDGHETTARLILALLFETLKADPLARGRFEALARKHESVRWAALVASPLPPSPEETSRLLTTEGLERVKARFRAACADDAPAGCVDAARFNSFGYALLGKHQVREAIAVLELVAWAHPGLANAQDSLADAYLAAGDRERARRSLQRAIELAPTDASLGPADRERSISEWTARIRAWP